MVKKVGFICEGETEKIIVESSAFQRLLTDLNLSCAVAVDASGNGNLLPKNIQNHLETMRRYKVDFTIILTDLDEDVCITKTKERIQGSEKNEAIIIVSVKTIESWFLADSKTLSLVFSKEYSYSFPEDIEMKPIDLIKQLFLENIQRGIGRRGKPYLANYMLKNGFNIMNAAEHANCPSAKYFIAKLREIALL
jgi:hypothetical protein